MSESTIQRPYSVMESVAFFDSTLPPVETFEPVLCHKMANDGLSFFWNGPTPKSRLVITIGSPLGQIFMVAEVLSERPVILDGKEVYKVECRFIRRVEGRYCWNEETKSVEVCLAAVETPAR